MSRQGPSAATIGGVTDASIDWHSIETVLCDLDGVIWLAHHPIAGSVEAVAALRASGRRTLFVTNNSVALRAEHEAALAAVGISAVGDVVSSSMAAAHLIEAGERVLVTGGPGVVEAVEQRGAIVVLNDGRATEAAFDAVVVGLDRSFDYARLTAATTAVLAGARLVATNTDSTFPTPHGLVPGGGSIVAAVATASGVTPVVGGKPHRPMADLIAEILTSSAGAFEPDRTLMVGDRPETDGLFAARLGCRFALVRSGVPTSASEASEAGVPVDLDVADLAAVARVLRTGG